MIIEVDRRIAFEGLDTLLELWKRKAFPYDQKDAILPQTRLPEALRDNPETLAAFYFYVCIYMRGGIESLQAFRALARMWQDHPEAFDPFLAQWLAPAHMEDMLRAYIGWDARRASINWVENSRRLVRNWDGRPLNLLKGLRSWTEALRRFRNKRTKRDLREAGARGEGFMGFQPKMVSMLVYFCDWEGWLEKRFLYPSPADFHNFRFGLNQGAITLAPWPGEIRTSEALSAPWRAAVLAYLRSRKADPIEVADALWLFSLVLCGNSPVTQTSTSAGTGFFEADDLPRLVDAQTFRTPRMRLALERTCLRCPVRTRCTLGIPSQPYYRKGILVLRPRPRIEAEYAAMPIAELAAAPEPGPTTPDLFDPAG